MNNIKIDFNLSITQLNFIDKVYMWQYYVITELRIIYTDRNNLVEDRRFVIEKETKHFVSYNGDLDSDESGYDEAVDIYYRQQLKRYDKIICLYSYDEYVKKEFKTKYESRVKDLVSEGSRIINIFKTKYTQIKL
jgi:hypothetical protein